MADYTNGAALLQVIQQAAQHAVNAAQPANVIYGTVSSESPLKIRISDRIELQSAQIALCRNVTDYFIEINIDDDEDSDQFPISVTEVWETETEDEHVHPIYPGTTGPGTAHLHKIKGRKTLAVLNHLVPGDEVAMVKMTGGQKYLVIDRVRTP